jgi:hypothetical protein
VVTAPTRIDSLLEASAAFSHMSYQKGCQTDPLTLAIWPSRLLYILIVSGMCVLRSILYNLNSTCSILIQAPSLLGTCQQDL